ncbi:hypothetical protein [Actinomadura litoris]|uniref:hypothetical protein n=1 Tax=Actinomadura litoris TaxID=2678616 RepID=UPI001FA7D83F|nr:hypothetical protein [Actinomadura litoris]
MSKTEPRDKPVILRVGTYNLFEGGLANLADHNRPGDIGEPDLDDSRLRKQLGLLSRHNFDVVGLQEATWGVHSPELEKLIAAELGMRWSFVGRSNFYGCDLATFVRTGDNLTVEHVEHLTGAPFVHGLTNVTIRITGRRRPIHVLVGHSAPSSPGVRHLEAETITVHRHLDVIYLCDHNSAAIDDNPKTTGLDPYKTAKKLDTTPAQELDAAGFRDVGRVWKDPTPTVGHGTPNEDGDGDHLAYRCDQIRTTLPTACITGYGVELNGDKWSDHRLVWAEFTIGR